MEKRYNLYNHDMICIASRKHEEFQEQDIWDVFENHNDFNSEITSSDSSKIPQKPFPTTARMIPKGNTNSNQEQKLIQHSAPVNIPEWSKINKTKTISFHVNDVDEMGNLGIKNSLYCEENDGNKLVGKIMPSHEWLAKKFARTRVSSFSVCEGSGKTLKGRELSRLRNAVLTRTGFLE